MNVKRTATAVLTLFLAASVLVLAFKSLRPTAGTRVDRGPGQLHDGLVAYYFHGNQRCTTCRTIEAFAREAVQSGFAPQLQQGSLHWRVLNYEDPANQPLAGRYKILAPVVVLSKIEGGRETGWTGLDRVWDLYKDKDAFLAYVRQNVAQMLDAPPARRGERPAGKVEEPASGNVDR